MLEWRKSNIINDDDYFVKVDGNVYDIFSLNNEFYYILFNLQGYLSRRLTIEGSFGGMEIMGLPQCQFDTVQEAMIVCERHQKLLILQ